MANKKCLPLAALLCAAAALVTALPAFAQNALPAFSSTPAPGGGQNYTNWELSSDRALATRRALLEGGLDDRQVAVFFNERV